MIVSLILWAVVAAAGIAGLFYVDLIRPAGNLAASTLLWLLWPLVVAAAIACLAWTYWGDLVGSFKRRRIVRWRCF